ncbi:hypothetical protein ACRBEV_05565 [Methylobacterium phyllosphaerae]
MLVRDPESRFAPQALLCTNIGREPVQIVSGFVRRWSVEVTCPARLALTSAWRRERQRSDEAIARTTPRPIALFSIVTLLARRLPIRERARITTDAWYAKPRPTFIDALAEVRHALWREQTSVISCRQSYRPNDASSWLAPGPTTSATPHDPPKSNLGVRNLSQTQCLNADRSIHALCAATRRLVLAAPWGRAMLLGFGVLTLGCLGYFFTEVLHAPVIEDDEDLCLAASAAPDLGGLEHQVELR